MRSFTAHLKPGHPPKLCREGWSWGAFLFGALWLVARLAWIPAVLELTAIAIAVAAVPRSAGLLLLALAILNGLLGRDLVRWSLERRGFRLSHVVLASNEDAALLRLLSARPELAQ